MKMAPLLSGRKGRGWWVAASAFRATTPDPSLIRRGIIFMHRDEPKDDGIFAQNDSLEGFFSSLLKVRKTALSLSMT
jgi:hypothetical protein